MQAINNKLWEEGILYNHVIINFQNYFSYYNRVAIWKLNYHKKTSNLSLDIYPPINLDVNENLELALVSLWIIQFLILIILTVILYLNMTTQHTLFKFHKELVKFYNLISIFRKKINN